MKIKSAINGEYTVNFTGLGLLLVDITRWDETFFLISETVAKLYSKYLPSGPNTVVYDATEANKTLDKGVFEFLGFLAERQATKHAKIVAIGGGAIQDIACMSAQIYKRGIEWEFVPTTLLSQVDSCIGGKSGINIGPYKNLIGGFWPPSRVHVCTDMLQTLPRREILSGMGEVVKHHMLTGATAAEFDWSDPVVIHPELVYSNLDIKREFIENDEFDRGDRLLLGLGHTFGHALEGATHFEIPHGVAVALGCDMAWFVSSRRGLTDIKNYNEWHKPLVKYFSHVMGNFTDGMMSRFGADKKAEKAIVNFVLFHGTKAKLTPLAIDDRLRADLNNYFWETLPTL